MAKGQLRSNKEKKKPKKDKSAAAAAQPIFSKGTLEGAPAKKK